MGELHVMPNAESRLVAEPIQTWAGPVPPEIMSQAIRRLRKCGVRLTTARLLNDDARACYSSLLGLVAGLEWGNQILKVRVLELEARLKELEGGL